MKPRKEERRPLISKLDKLLVNMQVIKSREDIDLFFMSFAIVTD